MWKSNGNGSRTNGCEGMQKDLKKVGMDVGWLKIHILKFQGRTDGRLGIPRPDRSGRWISPHMQREQDAVETYMAQKWGDHEIAVFEMQEEIQKLNLEISDIEAAIEQKRNEEPAQPTEEDLGAVTKQEQRAEPGVIRMRRHKEWQKRNAAYYSAVASLRHKADELKLKRAELKAAVDESACVVRLLCEKKRDLYRQRVDVYYHGVLKTHPDRKTMPPVPEFKWENLAETLYEQQHNMKEKEEEKNEILLAEESA